MIKTYREWNLANHDRMVRAYPGALDTVKQLKAQGARMGIVTVVQLKNFRTYFVVGAAAVGGLVTPPGPVSLLALLVPMYLLYEIGIVAAQLFIKHTQAPDEDAEAAKT